MLKVPYRLYRYMPKRKKETLYNITATKLRLPWKFSFCFSSIRSRARLRVRSFSRFWRFRYRKKWGGESVFRKDRDSIILAAMLITSLPLSFSMFFFLFIRDRETSNFLELRALRINSLARIGWKERAIFESNVDASLIKEFCHRV